VNRISARRVDQARAAKDNAQGAIRNYFQAAFSVRSIPTATRQMKRRSAGSSSRISSNFTSGCTRAQLIVVVPETQSSGRSPQARASVRSSVPAGTAYVWKTVAPRCAGPDVADRQTRCDQTYSSSCTGGRRKNPDRA